VERREERKREEEGYLYENRAAKFGGVNRMA